MSSNLSVSPQFPSGYHDDIWSWCFPWRRRRPRRFRGLSLARLVIFGVTLGWLATANAQPTAEPFPTQATAAPASTEPTPPPAPAKPAKKSKKSKPAQSEAAAPTEAAATPTPAATPAPAPAPTPAGGDMDKAKEAYLAGKGLFDAGEYAAAVEKFKESYRLSRNPLLLYNIALTHEKIGDDERALFYLNKFLTDAPLDAAPRGDAEARKTALEAKLDPKKAKRRPSQYSVESDFAHELVEELPPGSPADFSVQVPSDARWSITLFYRGAGSSTWKRTRFAAGEDDLWYARVPASAMRGTSLQYYIEVKGNDGSVLTRLGGITSPNIVSISADAAPMIADVQRAPTKRRPAGSDDESADTDESEMERDGTSPRHRGGMGLLTPGTKAFAKGKWISTGVGVGGLALGMTFALVASNKSSTLEGNAAQSRGTACNGGPPCLSWDGDQSGLQKSGKRAETWAKVGLGVGIAGVAVAGYYWYRELRAPKKERNKAVVPLVDEDTVGAMAVFNF